MRQTKKHIEPPCKTKIRLAAIKLFAERGIDNVAVKDIMRAARTTQPMLYYYFGCKDKLCERIYGDLMSEAVNGAGYALQLIENDGWDIKEALKEAGRVRLRPILMTVSAMVLGFVPMAISTKQGSEFWQPLSLTIIGGLTVSTVITLVLIPAAYYLIFRNRARPGEHSHNVSPVKAE